LLGHKTIARINAFEDGFERGNANAASDEQRGAAVFQVEAAKWARMLTLVPGFMFSRDCLNGLGLSPIRVEISMNPSSAVEARLKGLKALLIFSCLIVNSACWPAFQRIFASGRKMKVYTSSAAFTLRSKIMSCRLKTGNKSLKKLIVFLLFVFV
jgi:hypothetical protein